MVDSTTHLCMSGDIKMRCLGSIACEIATPYGTNVPAELEKYASGYPGA